MELTVKQKAAIESLRDGPALTQALVAHKLIGMGLMEKTGEAGARGQSHVRLTDAGRAAL